MSLRVLNFYKKHFFTTAFTLVTLLFVFAIGALSSRASAMYSYSNTTCSNQCQSSCSYGSNTYQSSGCSQTNSPAPYTGGASIAKVLYPKDGSTVTITSTGAVIKQSPGGNPYREGWVDPGYINSINSSSDLSGMMSSGSVNPYTQSSQSQNCCSNYSNNGNYPSHTYYNSSYSDGNNAPSASATAYSSSTSDYPSKPVSYTSPSPTTVTNTAAYSYKSPTPSTLPNTGAGNMLTLTGLTTVLGTTGHFIFQRYRNKSSSLEQLAQY
jgi:hypothetical protein